MIKTFQVSLILFLFAAVLFGCDSGPVTRPIDCPKDSIKIDTRIGYTGGGYRRDSEVVFEAVIKCNDIPVPDAEVRIDYWWNDSSFIYITDGDGRLRVERNVITDPRGHEVKVIVKGSDGRRIVKMRVEKNWE
jgi:hypothetical protein